MHTIQYPPIPIVPRVDMDTLAVTTIKHVYYNGTSDVKTSMELPVAEHPEPEVVLHVLAEFLDACDDDRLHLNSAALKFAKFRSCLRAVPRERWDLAYRTQANHTTDAHWNAVVDNWIGRFLDNSALQVQTSYFATYTKSIRIRCDALYDRLNRIEILARKFPNAGNPSFSDDQLKQIFHDMMLEEWKSTRWY